MILSLILILTKTAKNIIIIKKKEVILKITEYFTPIIKPIPPIN